MSDFKRGAEAMREMAARAAEENHGNRHGDPCPDVIRRLPLPDETCATCGIEFSPFGMPAQSFIKSALCTLPTGHIGHHKWTASTGTTTPLDATAEPTVRDVAALRPTLERWVRALGDTETLHDSECELTNAAIAGRPAGPCSCSQGSVSRVIVEMNAVLAAEKGKGR